MKSTAAQIYGAQKAAERIATMTGEAVMLLYASRCLWESDAPKMSLQQLRHAREQIANLRRTQTAALSNIDEALASMEVT